MKLENKTAIITGGAGVIGRAAAELFASEGARILLADRDPEGLEEAVSNLPSDRVSHSVADVSDPEQVQGYVQTAVERYGGVDVFLNNAAIEGEVGPIPDYPVEVFDRVMAVNVRGAWLGLKYVIPEMQKRGGGSVVITSSTAGMNATPRFSPYGISKHAVIGMMRAAAREYASQGIRVNTVNPAPIESRMMRSIESQLSPDSPESAKRVLTDRIPLGRYARPEEIARMMLFLASDESSFCTGGVYMVDGGWSS